MNDIDPTALKASLLPLVESTLAERPGEAAVLVSFIKCSGEWCLLLTQRAVNMRHHGGEVAFPGGMWEIGDHFPTKTALREAQEEVGLQAHQLSVLGTLPAMPTRNGTQVTPVVAWITEEPQLLANPAEIADIFFAPIRCLLPQHRIRTDLFIHRRQPLWAPAYNIKGYEVWGFTAGVIKILLERCLGVVFEREHPAPVKRW